MDISRGIKDFLLLGPYFMACLINVISNILIKICLYFGSSLIFIYEKVTREK